MDEIEKNVLSLLTTNSISVNKIAKKLKLSRQEVIDILIKNKYYKLADNPNAKLFSVIKLHDAAEYYIHEVYGKMAYQEVVKKFNIERKVMKDYLEKWYPNYPIIRYTGFDQTVFDKIDTEEKAYWLGFIYADGCIYNNGSFRFDMSLCNTDKTHLEKFSNFINFKRELLHKNVMFGSNLKPQIRIFLTGEHFYNSLNNLGCTPNKSLTLEFPNKTIFKDKSLIRHFIRGYFDGDGSIGIYQTLGVNTVYNKPNFNLLGTEKFLSELNKNIPIKRKIRSCDTENNPSKAFKIEGVCRDAFSFLFYIYHNSNIYLDRKYKKYQDICRLYEESYKELVSKIDEPCDENVELIASIAKGKATV